MVSVLVTWSWPYLYTPVSRPPPYGLTVPGLCQVLFSHGDTENLGYSQPCRPSPIPSTRGVWLPAHPPRAWSTLRCWGQEGWGLGLQGRGTSSTPAGSLACMCLVFPVSWQPHLLLTHPASTNGPTSRCSPFAYVLLSQITA